MKERLALLVATCVLLAMLAVPAVFVRQGRDVRASFRWLPVKNIHAHWEGEGLTFLARTDKGWHHCYYMDGTFAHSPPGSDQNTYYELWGGE
jgi:hypothetical protein